ALALSLSRLPGYRLARVVSRSAGSAAALCHAAGAGAAVHLEELPRAALDLVWLTVPDRELGLLGRRLAALAPFAGLPLFVHASGCLSLDSLAPLREAG